ncbi:MAG: hypothetical protein H0U32_06165 [Thermoleophilaceae bacterium]|nr:hypothetical protein [Thermoleophilaceae bacterium]
MMDGVRGPFTEHARERIPFLVEARTPGWVTRSIRTDWSANLVTSSGGPIS